MEFTTQLRVALSNNPTHEETRHVATTARRSGTRTGFSPSMTPRPKGLGSRASVSDVLSQGHNSTTPVSQQGRRF